MGVVTKEEISELKIWALAIGVVRKVITRQLALKSLSAINVG